MTPRKATENQRQYVERQLLEEGRVSAYAMTYEGHYEDGTRFGISRTAAIVETLRKVGWDIDTEQEHGQMATYLLNHYKATPIPFPKHAHDWQRGWTCTTCNSLPASVPDVRLGGLGVAACDRCGVRTYFRKRDAA